LHDENIMATATRYINLLVMVELGIWCVLHKSNQVKIEKIFILIKKVT